MLVSGVILAGGRSSRMRSNKAFAEINGQRMIESIMRKFVHEYDEVILVTNEPQAYTEYAGRLRVVTDIIPGKGPLSGVHSGLSYSSCDCIMVAACDMPFLSLELGRYMVGLLDNKDAVVPRIGDYYQPLFAVYNRKCSDILESALLSGKYKISSVYEQLDIHYVEEQEIKRFGDPDILFYNVNNRHDLQKAEEMARRVII